MTLVFCGPGGSDGIPRGVRSRLSIGNYRRVYRLAASRAELPDLDLHGAHDLRHTFATWLEDGGIPARVIDELLGHEASTRGAQHLGSTMGAHYRHTTPEMPPGSSRPSRIAWQLSSASLSRWWRPSPTGCHAMCSDDC